MKTRGRTSAAAQEIATVAHQIETTPRPDAPYDLTDEQSTEWWAVVNRMPADWFPRETHAMLAQYCRHVVAARRIAQLVDQTEKSRSLDIDAYDQLLKMQEREGRALSSLATRMRMSQQGSYDAKKTKGRTISGKMPWEPTD